MTRKTIKVDYLARVEGEAALNLVLRDGVAERVELRIFEPPRFFEALLRGRHFSEAPDITARICGICPVAYQMSAVHALENALNIAVAPEVHALRRLLYCGEWIESHSLHIYMLHAPDFLGYPSAVDLAKDDPHCVQRGLMLKKAGNELLRVIGGREIHPINVRVGGFYKAPEKSSLQALLPSLRAARDAALQTVQWVAAFHFPECERDYEFVALRHADEYPMNLGRIVSSRGVDIVAQDFETVFEEVQVPYSHALQARIKGRGPYLVGPCARYSLNASRLAPIALDAAHAAGLGATCNNPYRSIVVRAVEVLHACDEAIRLVEYYRAPEPASDRRLDAATGGAACTEAPRGILYHRYRIGADGLLSDARIVPPTSQNQSSIEEDLRVFVNDWGALDDTALKARCEQTIRNYDPCISCATHFLRLDVQRLAANESGATP